MTLVVSEETLTFRLAVIALCKRALSTRSIPVPLPQKMHVGSRSIDRITNLKKHSNEQVYIVTSP
jgi:hypothetical protein